MILKKKKNMYICCQISSMTASRLGWTNATLPRSVISLPMLLIAWRSCVRLFLMFVLSQPLPTAEVIPWTWRIRCNSFFDFCVSGEDDGVLPHRKPHAGIYRETLPRYQESVTLVCTPGSDDNSSELSNFYWLSSPLKIRLNGNNIPGGSLNKKISYIMINQNFLMFIDWVFHNSSEKIVVTFV